MHALSTHNRIASAHPSVGLRLRLCVCVRARLTLNAPSAAPHSSISAMGSYVSRCMRALLPVSIRLTSCMLVRLKTRIWPPLDEPATSVLPALQCATDAAPPSFSKHLNEHSRRSSGGRSTLHRHTFLHTKTKASKQMERRKQTKRGEPVYKKRALSFDDGSVLVLSSFFSSVLC